MCMICFLNVSTGQGSCDSYRISQLLRRICFMFLISRFWEKRNTVKHPKRLVNNSKLEFCFCTSPKVFVTRSQKHGKKPQAFGWFQASCFELAETTRSNKVAATVPSASCSSFAWLAHCCDGRRDTHHP